MQKVQPEMARLKEVYKNDKARLQQEMMLLYKRRKINPMSGCLPMLIQIPVFIALYNVLQSTFEMRHAPFLLVDQGPCCERPDLPGTARHGCVDGDSTEDDPDSSGPSPGENVYADADHVYISFSELPVRPGTILAGE